MNELESYALEVSDRVFKPLYDFDVFYYSLITSNPNYLDQFVREAMEKWRIPDEDQEVVENDIVKYAPI